MILVSFESYALTDLIIIERTLFTEGMVDDGTSWYYGSQITKSKSIHIYIFLKELQIQF